MKRVEYIIYLIICIYGTDANPRMARTSKMNMIIAYEIIGKKTKIKYLENNIEKLRGNAKQILQNEIFGKM